MVLEDLEHMVPLTYMVPWVFHSISFGTVCCIASAVPLDVLGSFSVLAVVVEVFSAQEALILDLRKIQA
jgi:hypothetical protein